MANYGTYPDYQGSVSVLLGNGDGSFQAAVNYAVGNTPVGPDPRAAPDLLRVCITGRRKATNCAGEAGSSGGRVHCCPWGRVGARARLVSRQDAKAPRAGVSISGCALGECVSKGAMESS